MLHTSAPQNAGKLLRAPFTYLPLPLGYCLFYPVTSTQGRVTWEYQSPMEKHTGKLVITENMGSFAGDFVAWAGNNTAKAVLQNEASEMIIELICEHNEENPLICTTGLSGGGSAVSAWAESSGYALIQDHDDGVTIETRPQDISKAAQHIAEFLAPAGRWRVTNIKARRHP